MVKSRPIFKSIFRPLPVVVERFPINVVDMRVLFLVEETACRYLKNWWSYGPKTEGGSFYRIFRFFSLFAHYKVFLQILKYR
jgi:hypothetical protein